MALEISSEITDTKTIIRIEGEVDVSNASELRDALDTALADGQESGSVLVVANPQKNVERVFSLLGVDKDLNVRK